MALKVVLQVEPVDVGMGPEVEGSTFAVPAAASDRVGEKQNLVPMPNCDIPALVNPVVEQNEHEVLDLFQVFARNPQSFPNHNSLHTMYPPDLFVFRTG